MIPKMQCKMLFALLLATLIVPMNSSYLQPNEGAEERVISESNQIYSPLNEIDFETVYPAEDAKNARKLSIDNKTETKINQDKTHQKERNLSSKSGKSYKSRSSKSGKSNQSRSSESGKSNQSSSSKSGKSRTSSKSGKGNKSSKSSSKSSKGSNSRPSVSKGSSIPTSMPTSYYDTKTDFPTSVLALLTTVPTVEIAKGSGDDFVNVCSPTDRIKCCAEQSINGGVSFADVCDQLGCSTSVCDRQKNAHRPGRIDVADFQEDATT